MENNELGKLVAGMSVKVEMLEKQFCQLRVRFDNHITDIFKRFDQLEKDLHGRPSWIISIMITMLFGACVMLLSAVLRK
ncbi:unnamed protein product [marine sediment metagenome]|uniref:Uncharacterized protein n=1 Tax=marine sediment metagenome TaxID=412755 RepID=X1AK11_9ZZZZ